MDWWYTNWRVFVPILISLLLGSGGIVGLVKAIAEARKKKKAASSPPENNEISIRPKQPSYEYHRGLIAYERGKYKEALEQLLIAIEACSRENPYSKDHAAALNDAGRACKHLTRYDDALEYFNKAEAILRMNREKNEIHIATVWNNSGLVYGEQRRWGDALHVHQKALEIRMRILGKKNSSVAGSYNNIGVEYANQGNYKKAMSYHRKALRASKKNSETYNSIGHVLRKQGKSDKAMRYFLKACEAAEKNYGSEHPKTAISLCNIGVVKCDQGRYGEAANFFLKAYHVGQQKLGEENPETRKYLQNLESARRKTIEKIFTRPNNQPMKEKTHNPCQNSKKT